MKEPRKVLMPYHGKCIKLQGIFNNFYNHIQYDFEKSTPKKSVPYDPQTGLITPVYLVDKNECPEFIHPIKFIDKGSVITNVKGYDEDSNIELDHIILQCDIEKTYNIALGSTIKLYGLVGAYTANNKDGGHDYCISEIININSV